MSKYWRLLLTATVLIAWLGLLFFPVVSLLFSRLYRNDQISVPAETVTAPLADGNTIGQSFFSSRSGLARIDIKFADHGRPTNYELVLQVRDVDEGLIAREKVFNSSLVKEDEVLRFSFEPIADSAGREYEFSVKEVASESRGDGYVSISRSVEDSYPRGSLYENGAPAGGDLCFNASYKEDSFLGFAKLLLQRLSKFKFGLFSSSFFYAGLTLSWLLFAALLIAVAIISVLGELRRDTHLLPALVLIAASLGLIFFSFWSNRVVLI